MVPHGGGIGSMMLRSPVVVQNTREREVPREVLPVKNAELPEWIPMMPDVWNDTGKYPDALPRNTAIAQAPSRRPALPWGGRGEASAGGSHGHGREGPE